MIGIVLCQGTVQFPHTEFTDIQQKSTKVSCSTYSTKYPINNVELKAHSIPVRSTYLNWDSAYSRKLPVQAFLCLFKNTSFCLLVFSQTIPGYPIDVNFRSEGHLDTYHSLFTRKSARKTGVGMTLKFL